MTDNKPAADVTKDWQATKGQKSGATRLRLFAAPSWIIPIWRQRSDRSGGELRDDVVIDQSNHDREAAFRRGESLPLDIVVECVADCELIADRADGQLFVYATGRGSAAFRRWAGSRNQASAASHA